MVSNRKSTEALVIFFVFIVAVVGFGVSWFMTAYGPDRNRVGELLPLDGYREERRAKTLRRRLEKWDNVLMDQIAGKPDEVACQIVETAGRPEVPPQSGLRVPARAV